MRALTLILLAFYGVFSSIIPEAIPEPGSASPGPVADPYALIRKGQALLKEGDLVVRLNRDPTSQFIKNFNREDKTYSHAGIVLFEKGYPFIYHIVNGEENPDEIMRRDSLDRFCNPRNNMAYGIYRYRWHDGEAKRLKEIIHQWYARKIRFDAMFNLGTDDKMYCSEMIGKALGMATHNRILVKTTRLTPAEAGLITANVHLPESYTNGLRIISIDNLYKISDCDVVEEFSY